MFDPTTLVGSHTWLSLIAIAAGIPVAAALLRGEASRGWSGLYLATAIATSATGFLFPFTGVLPSHIFGVISLLLLLPATYALYGKALVGGWGRLYAIAAMLALYLLAFVAVVQAFLKTPALNAIAPTQSEPPFAIAQGVLLVVFTALTWLAARRFGPSRTPA
jgi:hypothetical protein